LQSEDCVLQVYKEVIVEAGHSSSVYMYVHTAGKDSYFKIVFVN
jgi:hypothetical protein